MKLNSAQKIIFLFYILIIIFIFIFHIPFIVSYDNIEYDGIFSNNKKIDYQRLLLVIFFISFIAASTMIIFKKENFYFILIKWKIITISIFFFSLIFGMVLYNTNKKSNINSIQNKVVNTPLETTVDTVVTTVDTTYSPQTINSNCNTVVALQSFKKEMNFTYPDWKVKGDPVIEEISSCTYNIRFSTYNPHLSSVGVTEKEVHIVQIEISGDSYYFKQIRGTLY